MENKENILEVENLQVSFHTYAGEVKAVRGVSFSLSRGETLAFVGESGCGKSVTAKSIMRLLKPPVAEIKPESKIICDEKDVMKMSGKEIYALRGDEISMIFQDPMTSLNPTMKVGKQIMESLMLHRNMKKAEARKEAIRMLKMVNIPSAEKRVDNYPHEMSGGMRQRVMIAMALACNPKILIADEPTTALDVTIQAQILERGTAKEIFYESKHPYTWALLSSVPKKGDASKEELYALKGTPQDLILPLNECPFASRCEYCMEICKEQNPMETSLSDTHKVSCWLMYPKAPKVKSFYDREER